MGKADYKGGAEGGDNGTPTFCNRVSDLCFCAGTTVGGQFGWGGTPLKRYQGRPNRITSYNVCYTKLLRADNYLSGQLHVMIVQDHLTTVRTE